MRRTALFLFFLFLGLLMIIAASKSTYEVYRSSVFLKEEQQRLLEERRKNEALRKELEYKKSDFFVEKEARDKLSLGKEGETAVIIPGIKDASSSASLVDSRSNPQKWFDLFFNESNFF
ncbi:MAG: hypothetical protein A2Y57_02975 [Candidatus Woykebacteria bacterium RBG_13_40_7b]|uniref:Septum formation initiator n=1 Tax=Candidatus Woykebacteria bacterium RBG_13_40_7b TaxID=1802594 RepID=A0A1G1W7R2_9BACT|nr:MAG: hypothetical protein A2Y57_02975 [Candidatus Woykebacteria bacterium RBG_13_40_7b]